ncbi:MAG: precorrin-3B C(17)-methyltransferase, partial [Pseudomonadota bacterium]
INRAQLDKIMKAAARGHTITLRNDTQCPLWFTWQDQTKGDVQTEVVIGYGEDACLVPQNLVVGVGCARDAAPDVLQSHVKVTLQNNQLSPHAVAAFTSVNVKEDEPAVHLLARYFQKPLRWFGVEALRAIPVPNPSEHVREAIGCDSVSEASALALSQGTLRVEKAIGDNVTAAVAQATNIVVIDETSPGYGRGHLSVVGVGPGARQYRTEACRHAISGAADIVGLQFYIDLVADLCDGKTLHEAPLGKERERCEMALDLAAMGRDVCLLASGDAGIYALATLVEELLSQNTQWRGVGVTVIPGISAFQALAAKVGAPVSHDFCLISLSDLLTPQDVIEQRVKAALAGDFVICLYNPQSKTRRALLQDSVSAATEARGQETVVIIGRNVGRKDETVEVTSLGTLNIAKIDMFTMLIIGVKETQCFAHLGQERVFTPRGYRQTP